jgi:hypothetical protein
MNDTTPGRPVRRWLTVFVLAAAAALTACGDVNVAADVDFPKPLIEPLPLKLGVYYSDDFAKYQHAEERWGVEWKIELGKFHVMMTERLFGAAFRDLVELKAPADGQNADVRAVIEPRIEQYSFITPRDTGAKYYAVTIKYRLNVFAPDGRLADSLTFTGYGSAPSSGMTSTKPMLVATRKAMRDAAAKFLVQFPEQDVVKKLVAGLPISGAGQAGDGDEAGGLEAVPIIDPQAPMAKPGSAPGGGTPPIVPPAETKDQPAPSGNPQGETAPPAQQPPPERSQQVPPTDTDAGEEQAPEESPPPPPPPASPGDEKIPEENPAPPPPVPPT